MFRAIRHGWRLLEKLQGGGSRKHCSDHWLPLLCSSLSTSASSSRKHCSDHWLPLLCSSLSTSASSSSESSGLPPPIRVSLTDSAGRGTFATRRIGAGDLIHTANPIVSHPSISLLSNVCYLCLKRLGMKSSATAGPTQQLGRRISFCSEECRENAKAFYEVEKVANWSEFDDHCRLLGLKYPFLVKRLACMIISGVASIDCLDILQPASLPPEMISEMEEEFQLLRHTFLKAGYDEKITFLTKQWYIGVLARIRINGFRVEIVGGSYEDLFSAAAASVVNEAAVGNAVYMLPSFYNHDCDPNAHIYWNENANARLNALRDIEADEELRICYIDASMNHAVRQRILFEGFGFRCTCLRCMSGD